jgi:hypothetical protein
MHIFVTCSYFPAPTSLLLLYLHILTCSYFPATLNSLQLPLHPPPGKPRITACYTHAHYGILHTHATRHVTHTCYTACYTHMLHTNRLHAHRLQHSALVPNQLSLAHARVMDNTRHAQLTSTARVTRRGCRSILMPRSNTGQHGATWGQCMGQYLRDHCAFVALVFTSGDQIRRVYL